MLKSRRVLLCGSHSVGKSTLRNYISERWGLPKLHEVARTELTEREDNLRRLAGDLRASTDYQEAIWRRQIAAEREMLAKYPGGYVADRAFDNIAYCLLRATPGTTHRLVSEPESQEYLVEIRRSATVFFVRPHKSLLAEDGVRFGVDWDSVVRIDGAVLALLEVFGIPYVPISCQEPADRARVVEGVLGPPDRLRIEE